VASLVERYRPASLGEMVGQDTTVDAVAGLRPWGGRAFWLSGASGVGKTTMARIIAREVAGTEPGHIRELDAGDLTESRVGAIAANTRPRALFGGWAIIVNEAHGLKPAVARKLLSALEPIPEHCVWIFTTTKKGQKLLFEKTDDAFPLMSRCQCFELRSGLDKTVTARAFAHRAAEIAAAEGLNGTAEQAYFNAVGKRLQGSMRELLQAVERGEFHAKGE